MGRGGGGGLSNFSLDIAYILGLATAYLLSGTPRTYAIKTLAVTDN